MKRTEAIGQPDPSRYVIEDTHTIIKGQESWIIVTIRYLDCTNYEGRKILVFRNITVGDIINAKAIDPHFCDNPKHKGLVPVARFEPTDWGKHIAVMFCEMMVGMPYGQ